MNNKTALARMLVATTMLSLATLAAPAAARESARVLYVPTGTAPTKAAGTITGKNDALYRITAKAGQQLSVNIWSDRTTTYFNIERPDGGEALFVGQNAVEPSFDQPLPATGSYLIRVYQMGAAASENKRTKYELVLRLENATSVSAGATVGGGNAAAPGGGGASTLYSLNRLSNGNFEIVFPDRGCIATANRSGEILGFSDRCTDDLTARARDIARREK
jgi:hypothetical protein